MSRDTAPNDPLDLERRALTLAEAALEQPVHLQKNWLEKNARGETELLQRAKELLDAVEVATTLHEDESALSRRHEQAASTNDFGAGDAFGSYQIEEEIGRGGMGVVYRARRADESFDLSVALKVMRPLAGVDAKRFEAERRILARLDHPNVARILDGGRTPQGTPFLVMELVEGLPIDRYCDRQRATLKQRIEIFLGVCDGVTHAHQNLVVHRDLKPGNIQISAQGLPKLLDFGIAKLLEPDGSTPSQTLFGQGAMTPEYASPEQIRHQPITVATDVYSLGVILYELLTGVRPYTIEDRSPSSLERLICETSAPSPSSMARASSTADSSNARRLNGDRLARELEGDLDTIVLTALGKQQEDRYPTVAALAADLRCYLQGRPIEARAHDWTYVASRFVRRNRRQVALASAAAALILSGASLAVVQSLRAAQAGREAEIQAERAVEANEFLSEMLSLPDPIFGEGKDTRVADLLGIAAGRLDQLSSETRSAMATTLGETYYNLGLSKSAQELLVAEIEVSEQALGPNRVETLHLEFVLSKILGDVGDIESALEILERIAPILAPLDLEFASAAYGDLATAHSLFGNFEEAEANYKRSIEIDEAISLGTPDHLSQLNNLAVLYNNNQMFDRSETILRRAVRLSQQTPNTPPFVTAQLTTTLAGTISQARPEDPEADRLYAEGIGLFDQNLGPEHPTTINSRAQLTNRLWGLGKLAEALEISVPNLETAEAHLPEEHMQLGFARVVHCGVLVDLGRAAEIYDTIVPVVSSRRDALPEGHFLIASAEVLLGASLLALDRTAEASSVLESAHAVLAEQRGPDDPKTLQALALLEEIRAQGVN